MLAYLEDIRTEDLYDEDGEDEGYKLTFTFSDNPFMTDKELSVEYRVVETGGYVSVRDIQGSDIHWKADKDVTVKKMKKKPKPGSKAKPLVKVEPVDSFFRWFSPPEVPEEGEEEADDEDIEAAEEHMALGELLREQIIPNAVEWFTGVAALEGEESLGEDEFDDEEEDDEDDEDDDEDEDEDDDDDDEEEEGDAAGRGPKDSKDPAECKQQ